ncbi:penicillin-binding protein 2 [uncultured Eubacterium sp.]|uniref:peptidoglycan D,D-transpeptidase FtsI family protein n=1 Tax=uncultured Eubacterium sp. TaxID=165185 RepID=UPI0025EBD7D1|nr:penicillin-binding protein 2 [uncultured Eubacterium sp.]
MRPRRRRKKEKSYKFLTRMKAKMLLIFIAIAGVLICLVGRLAYIELKSGDKYAKIVLNQQEYSSKTIPFRRGDIVDRKGTVLATSTDVYNVILDCSVLTSKEAYLEPTLSALNQCFGLDTEELRSYISANPKKRYYVLAKKLPYDEIAQFESLQNDKKTGKNIKGVWFEKEYIRNYPYDSLSCSILGFTTSGNEGIGGLEDYYNSTLNGIDGKEYGYVNSDSNYEIKVKDATDGSNVVSTIDANLQSIVESKIAEFNNAMKDSSHEGAKNIGVIMMDPNNGEVLAMATNRTFSLQNPWDADTDKYFTEDERATIIKQAERVELKKYYSLDEINAMTDDQWSAALNEHYSEEQLEQIHHLALLNQVWNNFCVSSTYEPGSTAKPFTVATGLDSGTLTGNETFYCDGGESISGHHISCIKKAGHGMETVQQALENSCNDALMQMSYLIGPANFSRYQQIFNFGLKTNIDLPGEARTDSLIYSEDQLSTINLATNSFGQSYNVTMIQMIAGYCSLINGGKYYQPHMVCKIEDSNGNTVQNIEPTLMKETISEETSATIRQYLQGVVVNGSGKKAKVDGYSMGGKTGTAQKLPRSARKYLVSFIGSVPADNPQVAIYVVVDEANSADQAHSYYAQSIAREILKEALPYMGIYPDEEKTGVNEGIGITGEGTPVETTTESMDSEVPTQAPQSTEDSTSGQ